MLDYAVPFSRFLLRAPEGYVEQSLERGAEAAMVSIRPSSGLRRTLGSNATSPHGEPLPVRHGTMLVLLMDNLR